MGASVRNVVFVSLTLAVCLGGQAAAQSRITKEIDVDAEKQDLADLMDEIGRKAGVNIVVHPDIKEEVTIRLRRVPWRVAVDVIAERTGCTITAYPGGVVGLKQPRKVSIQFENASLRTVLMVLADYADASIVLGPDVKGTVTVDLKDVDYLSAMKAIVDTASSGRLVVLGTGKSFKVGDTGSKVAVEDPQPEVHTLQGRLLKLSPDSVLLRKDGQKLRCFLPAKKAKRRKLHALLSKVRRGDRIALTYLHEGQKLVVADLIAQSR